MPRIAEKELVVNLQMKMQMECSCPQIPLYVYNPGWGSESIDPVTGKMAKFYDYVPRNIKLTGGIQFWILVPRYRLADGSTIFRVLPSNLCVFKHYALEVIQDEIDAGIERIQKEKDAAGGGQAARADDESDRPCERSKWLWLLWFFKNLMLIESVLRYVHLVHASMSASGIEKLEEILTKSDYLLELRIGQPEEWLKIVVQTAWNTGMPLIPLRNIQTIREVLEWNRVHPIPG